MDWQEAFAEQVELSAAQGPLSAHWVQSAQVLVCGQVLAASGEPVDPVPEELWRRVQPLRSEHARRKKLFMRRA